MIRYPLRTMFPQLGSSGWSHCHTPGTPEGVTRAGSSPSVSSCVSLGRACPSSRYGHRAGARYGLGGWGQSRWHRPLGLRAQGARSWPLALNRIDRPLLSLSGTWRGPVCTRVRAAHLKVHGGRRGSQEARGSRHLLSPRYAPAAGRPCPPARSGLCPFPACECGLRSRGVQHWRARAPVFQETWP